MHDSDSSIIFLHILPNSLASILVAATLGIAGAILTESALSFLGIGVPATVPTWGTMLNAARSTCFLIADISGYTGYLAGVELDHAQDILADLIGGVVSALRPGFRLAKLEGDAAFTFATTERIDGTLLLDTIERCYLGFRRRRRDVRQATSCPCNACIRIPDLDLKFVVHHGAAISQKVAGRTELLGSDVIVVHRLLKNDVVERLGMSAYALLGLPREKAIGWGQLAARFVCAQRAPKSSLISAEMLSGAARRHGFI